MFDLKATHPDFTYSHPDWVKMRDSYKGERQVKSKGTLYLPMTDAQIQDGGMTSTTSVGFYSYNGYKQRARFPNFVREAVQTAIGMMHSQPPEIKLPKAMENIVSRQGEPLPVLLRRINTEQLLTGRIGILADLPSAATRNQMPYLATYVAERITNWDDGRVEQLVPQRLNFVILNESEYERQDAGFTWETEEKHRVLSLGPHDQNVPEGIYSQGVFEDEMFNPSMMKAPSWMGRTSDEIQFTIINSCDISADTDDPPLLDLAEMCMAIYRGEADYRQNLYMQGQDTLVIMGGAFDETDEIRVGAGSRLVLPQGADAKYIGVESSGLEEQRSALERLEARAGTMGAQTLDSTSRERESGDSLRIRVAARTADLNQIADTGAEGLQEALRKVARWVGENPDDVQVTPNKDFGEMPLTGQSMVEIATARNLGWPISARSMHDLAYRRRMTRMTFDEEIAQAKKEDEQGFVFGKPETGDRAAVQPNDPNGPRGQNQVPGQGTNPSGRDA
jgi:hypothetical protein